MKIAMLGHKSVPARDSSRGGIEVVVEELSTRMVKKNNTVVCFNRKGSQKHFIKKFDGVKNIYVPTIDKKGVAAVSSSFFASILVAFGRYDVVHYHAEGPCFWIWIPRLFGKRCVATIHGIDWQREKWRGGLGSNFIHRGEKNAVKYANEIIVLSKNVQNYFMKTYGRETRFIPNGVSKPMMEEAKLIKENYGLIKDQYVLYLARIVPEKGLKYLITAYKQIRTDKKLVIAGAASDTDAFAHELKELAGNDENIIFTGFVSGKLKDELYSNAYIYTLPSDLEGMPLSLLEAMSYGNCCLVSDIDECTEVIENKAVVFEKSNIDDLKDKLQYLCDHPEVVNKYKSNASEFICNKYNWDDVVDETIELYKNKSK